MLSNKNCFYKHVSNNVKVNIFVKKCTDEKITTYQNLIKTPIYTKQYNYNNEDKTILFAIIENSPINFSNFNDDLEFKNEEIHFNTFKDLCNIMNIPGIVVLNTFCECIDKKIFYDVYYYSCREDIYIHDFKKSKNKKK